eukprot:TRINITY_DN6969_c0_g3_i7.p1 TRINITY_DN6969_c0_g3~~TRINITY_DN6969_c0_g3_i7.p1  ORF type:complete len:959 (-),score=271.22 TRINITY_DN6969_c0_g3_i7:513-3245(-)
MEESKSFFKKLDLSKMVAFKKVQDNTIFRKEIARGAASVVYYAQKENAKQKTKQSFVMKTYSCRWMFDNKNFLDNELEHFGILAPLGIVPKMLEVLRTSNNIYISLELCNSGSLDMHLKREKRFPMKVIQELAHFLSLALFQLRTNNILHRDINPQHILVNVSPNGQVFYKFTGLQFCKQLSKGKACSFVGCAEYLAPEVVSEEPYDYKADVWAVGTTLYELAMGANCFKIDPNCRVNIKAGKPPTFPDYIEIDEKLKDLITKCLMYDPNKRISIDDFMSHPFLAEDVPKPVHKIKEATVEIGNLEIINMIKDNFGKFIEFTNKKNLFKRKLEAEVRLTLDPYVLESDKPACSGGFSDIYFCTNRETNIRYVLKIIKKHKITDAKVANLLLGEVAIMLELNSGSDGLCPFTIGLEDYFVYNNTLCIVIEYCNGGDMENFVRMARDMNTILSQEQFKLLAWNTACGLNEMHKRGMMHRDVKAKNVLVIKDPTTDELIDLKLCDYGLSKQVAEYQEILGSTILGTIDYFAPELYAMMEDRLAGKRTTMQYTPKVDVWSYGVLLYFTLYGRTIMEPPGSRYKVMKQKKIEFPEVKDAPEGLMALIKRALKFDPEERPDFMELLKDPFFTTVVLNNKPTLHPYVQGNLIAEGEIGKTKIFQCSKGGKPYAMKVMEESKVKEKRLLAEIDTLGKIRNSNNVIRLHDYFTMKKNVYIILKYYKGGDLESYIKERHKNQDYLSQDEAIFIAYSVLNGIKDMHLRNIIHRNIHPSNILLELNPNKSVRNAVVGGFGFARILLEGGGTTVVTTAYQSPEMILEEYKGKHDSKVDIWAYGMLLYYVMFGIHPSEYPENKNLYKILTTGEINYNKEHAKRYPGLVKTLSMCLMPNPHDRPTAMKLLSVLPIFRKYLRRVFK